VVEHARGGHRRPREGLVLLDRRAHVVAGHPVTERDVIEAGVGRGARDRLRGIEQLAREVAHPQRAQHRTRPLGRVATTAWHAGRDAAIRRRSEVSIGIPSSRAIAR
jgi:hypothetical protein